MEGRAVDTAARPRRFAHPTRSQWTADWNLFYDQRGMAWGNAVRIDSGWQPGSGDGVAIQTITRGGRLLPNLGSSPA